MYNVFRSYRVLVGDDIISADIIVDDQKIVAVAPHGSMMEACDVGNRLVAPGFVDLHSDAIEKEIEPRPGARFPVQMAITELDRKLGMAGITTMFHAIGFNDASLTGNRGTRQAAELIRQIVTANEQELTIDNLIHARYELTSFASVAEIKRLIDDDTINLLSVMDHTPGQGQFQSVESWKRFHLPAYGISSREADKIIAQKLRDKNISYELLRKLFTAAAARGIMLASHDDDMVEKVDFLSDMGVTISEFPLSVGVARHAHRRGLATGMGAPNVIRGESQSGNISARELISEQVCDFVCSDYHPSSLLQVPYVLERELGMPLPAGFAMVSSTPARIAGLKDRGVIAPGSLADLVVIEDEQIPRVVMTIKNGIIIYSGIGSHATALLRQELVRAVC
ncbi:MAG: alpha-D-ribose 1-methylphosphonate 5-triphosphate diphosphatase [Deltaproteobacteria bacterium]|nr:alpha-D-ribose 1-methylphosphonate 5-triphosphate diphosphatase [Candidatus Anaeroferrophillus wilburensis]MBN2890184.1 alpha-D-ribose 1-methylphosphonate 5-triphosphate diphosphatase [Deltaproteobacteria bacterium]